MTLRDQPYMDEAVHRSIRWVLLGPWDSNICLKSPSVITLYNHVSMISWTDSVFDEADMSNVELDKIINVSWKPFTNIGGSN